MRHGDFARLRWVLRNLAHGEAFVVILAATAFGTSGRLDWAMAWAYVCVLAGLVGLNTAAVARTAPDLLEEREQARDGTKRWDLLLAPLVAAVGPIGMWLVAGLDVRFGWSQGFSVAAQIASLVAAAAGVCLTTWAMLSNRFFSSVVRIQEDRGHTVATAGPYRFVRHPGYLGFIMYDIATPLVLGSYWGLIPAGITIGLVVLRTSLEDVTLQEELEGYRDYARRVRYRLVPWVW